jgi:hypothetical protein
MKSPDQAATLDESHGMTGDKPAFDPAGSQAPRPDSKALGAC